MRAVTLLVNFKRLHRGVMYSKKMRLPAFGALGSIKVAGTSRSSDQQANSVTSRVQAIMETEDTSA